MSGAVEKSERQEILSFEKITWIAKKYMQESSLLGGI